MSDQLEEIKKKLKCEKCSKSFKEPKLLPCYHSFCKSPCLEELAARDPEGKTLTCPTCEYQVTLPDNGVAGLPTDLQAEYIAEQKGAIEKAKNPICGNCKKSPATNYCPDCKKFMCDKCREMHQTWEAFKDHTLLSTDQVRADAIKVLLPNKEPLQCEKHPTMELRMYCETCSELICSDCTIRLHKDHEYDVVDDVFPRHKKTLESSLGPLKENLQSIEEALGTLDTRQEMIEKQRKAVEKDIKDEIEKIKKLLDMRKNQLVDSLKSLTEQKLARIASQKKCVKNTQAKMSSCLKYAEAGLENGTNSEVLRMKVLLLRRIEEISKAFDKEAIQPTTEADIELITDNQTEKACKELGNVTSVCVSAENSYATGEGTKLAKLESQAIVEVHPAINERSRRGEQNFTLTAELSHAKTTATIECNYTREVNGRHTITYQPVSRGRHSLHIRINGRHVKDSPYPIAVTPSLESLRKPTRVWQTWSEPYGLAINSNRDIIIAGQNEDCVCLVSSKGQNISRFSKPGWKTGQLKTPCGVTVDQSDNIYVADNHNHRIQKFAPDGRYVDSVGSKGAGGSKLQFMHPTGICFNKTNELLYVCDQDNHRIQVITTDLTFVNAFGEKGKGNGQFDCPLNLAFDDANNVYVTDTNNNRVQVFTLDGQFLRKFSDKANGKTLSHPNAIAIDSGNVVYVSEYDRHCVSMFTSLGEYLGWFGGPGEEDGKFNGIYGLCIDPDDIIYVSDCHNKKLQIF